MSGAVVSTSAGRYPRRLPVAAAVRSDRGYFFPSLQGGTILFARAYATDWPRCSLL